MINQLFGLKNVKNSAELKSVGKRKNAVLAETESNRGQIAYFVNESWCTGEKDALRVPILARAHTRHVVTGEASLPAFGTCADRGKYQSSDTNPYGVSVDSVLKEGKCTSLSIVSTPPSADDLLEITIGVYSKSPRYASEVVALLSQYDISIRVFGATDIEALEEVGQFISTWVIDLSDESDCPVLELLLEEFGDAPSLFLSDTILTGKCISKLNTFVKNDTLKLTA